LIDLVAQAFTDDALGNQRLRWNGVCVFCQESPTASRYLMARHKRRGIKVLFTAHPDC
jgi:hypothetical protein